VKQLRRGLAGATVFRGMAGFGANSVMHTTSILCLSEDLPILVEIVDSEDRMDLLAEILDDLSNGQFLHYTWTVPGGHAIAPERLVTFWTTDLAPTLPLLALTGLGLAMTLRTSGARRAAARLAWLGGFVVVSLAARLRADSTFFRRNEEAITAVINLIVFVFIMTGIVYETQHWRNPAIANYVDALYFTVTALTTTGFGDITLQGSLGRLTAVVIMIFGVTLFLRLLQTLLRPQKVRFPCPECGLQRHEADAVFCKACGTRLNIPDEGRF